MNIVKEIFGEINDEPIFEYTLTNSNNLSLSVITFGGIITKIMMPNNKGKTEEITVNMTTLEETFKSRPFHGAIIGPVAGRISNAFYMDHNTKKMLDENENGHTLHGGFQGLDNRIWNASYNLESSNIALVLNTTLPEGESGFPGEVNVTVEYRLNENDEISIYYSATTTKRTLFNPTNHVYFNLSGNHNNKVDDHMIQINADYYAVLDESDIPTGELKSVSTTPFDLRKNLRLKNIIHSNDKEISTKNGLNHPFVLNKYSKDPAVVLLHDKSGRKLEVETDCDAVVVYTHNHMQKSENSFERLLQPHCGIALETQQLPDAVNHNNFGSIWLEPKKSFSSTTVYRFSIIN